MAENYEVIYTHPSGATATFIRQGGELDALAKGLDAEQFWIFKQVKSLLVRNDEGDLGEAHRLMATVGFSARVRELIAPEPAPSAAALRQAAFAGSAAYAPAPAVHSGPHMPSPSYWPLLLALSVAIAFGGLLVVNSTVVICAIGVVFTFISIVGWGLEPIDHQ